MNQIAPSLLILMLLVFDVSGALPAGNISIPITTTSRVVRVSVAPPGTNIHWVRLSQDPDLNRTNGLRITIVNLHTNLDYADLNITYPNGVPGGRGLPAGLPKSTNYLRALVIPVRLSDSSEIPSYATNGWFHRLIFGETNGPDGRNLPNSARKYFEHNSYGRFRITGEVYPDWVTVRSARDYSSIYPTGRLPEQYVEDAILAIKAQDPNFFDNRKYDFVITLHTGDFYATSMSYYDQTTWFYGISSNYFRSGVHLDLPVEPNSRLLRPITNEINTVSNSIYVRTMFRPSSVQGVWLASDTNHLGINYYVGGSLNREANRITLGTPVPSGNEVQVDYSLPVSYQTTPGNPFFSISDVSVWYGMFLHEFAHALGIHMTFTETDEINDLYQNADLLYEYSLMAGGNHNILRENSVHWNEPAFMEGYSRYALGLVHPYELRYGENEANLRLYATAEFPYTERTKLIKIPLSPDGVWTRRRYRTTDYWGEEYLLVELRKKRPVAGMHNFDRAIPHEGVFVYHVFESDKLRIGDFRNFVRIIDATPLPSPSTPLALLRFNPHFGALDSLRSTPAPFGFDSGRFEYVHAAPWQNIGNSNLYMRVDGRGPITVYAQFRDNTYADESEICSAAITYDPWPDTNENDIDDAWEMKYFGTLDNLIGAGDADADGDGISNGGEFIAGTNPTNALSTIGLWMNMTTNGTILSTHLPNGTFYYVEHTRSLFPPRWRWINNIGRGYAEPDWSWRDASGAARYFRIVVREPL
jgi:hypothetical protein